MVGRQLDDPGAGLLSIHAFLKGLHKALVFAAFKIDAADAAESRLGQAERRGADGGSVAGTVRSPASVEICLAAQVIEGLLQVRAFDTGRPSRPRLGCTMLARTSRNDRSRAGGRAGTGHGAARRRSDRLRVSMPVRGPSSDRLADFDSQADPGCGRPGQRVRSQPRLRRGRRRHWPPACNPQSASGRCHGPAGLRSRSPCVRPPPAGAPSFPSTSRRDEAP